MRFSILECFIHLLFDKFDSVAGEIVFDVRELLDDGNRVLYDLLELFPVV